MQRKAAAEDRRDALTLAREAAARVRAERKGETNHARGRRLANTRVNTLLFKIRQVGNLGAPIYELTDAEKEKICEVIWSAVLDMKRRLENIKGQPAFDL